MSVCNFLLVAHYFLSVFHNLIVDETNNGCLHYLEACISIFTILDQPRTHCDNFSNNLTDFESLYANCQNYYIQFISVKFHYFIK